MAGPAGGRGSSHGIDRAVLEAGVGRAGAGLEARAPEAGGSQQDVWHVAPVPSQEQPRAARAKERLRRRRTDDQTVGGARAGSELRAGSGTAALANGDEAEAPVDARRSEEHTSEPSHLGIS